MSDTSTIGDVELVLSELDFEPDDGCEYGDCSKEATHTIVCPCGVGAENICDEHAKLFRNVAILDMSSPTSLPMVLTFTNTCHHNARVQDCTIIPL